MLLLRALLPLAPRRLPVTSSRVLFSTSATSCSRGLATLPSHVILRMPALSPTMTQGNIAGSVSFHSFIHCSYPVLDSLFMLSLLLLLRFRFQDGIDINIAGSVSFCFPLGDKK